MPLDDGFEQALRSAEPVNQLRSLALRLHSGGLDKAAIIEKFEGARRELRLADREADEDVIMDAMDCLVGWCSPQMILPLDDHHAISPAQDKDQ
jgi:hypothetical protein